MAIEFLEIKEWTRLFEKKTTSKISQALLQSLGVWCQYNWVYMEYYTSGNSSAVISTMRGASIPSLILNGKEIFYNDHQRRNDFTQKLREWFRMGPQTGNFSKEEMWKLWYDLNQHGFLRDEIWTRQMTNNEIIHTFQSSQRNLKQFPHKFTATQKIQLEQDTANIRLEVKNTGEKAMPFAPGHHTYYKVSPSQKKDVLLDNKMWVDDSMKSRWIAGEETLDIENPWSCKINIPGTGELQLDFDEKFKRLRLRSEKDKWFVCIEPVIDNAKRWLQSSILTQPGEILKIWFSIKLLNKDT